MKSHMSLALIHGPGTENPPPLGTLFYNFQLRHTLNFQNLFVLPSG